MPRRFRAGVNRRPAILIATASIVQSMAVRLDQQARGQTNEQSNETR